MQTGEGIGIGRLPRKAPPPAVALEGAQGTQSEARRVGGTWGQALMTLAATQGQPYSELSSIIISSIKNAKLAKVDQTGNSST